ncbi:hypothetical protein [Salidesulfovibrio onnuriiensis]|uniref:hypothetical protein n=1 Tax=Salidesulfovibrio onnuriiensis TaxID=2583823 RepID=UPI0011C8A566|nr:hypothetical protein [Salidesulfovibrio onnuriiensis]
MDPTALIPVPDAIPMAWGWFEGLNILTFTLHMILVNVLVGGGFFALYLTLNKRADLAAPITRKLPTVFALVVNFGVAPLLFLQVVYGHFFYSGSVLSAAWWLGVILLLIAGYYALYIHQHKSAADPANRGGYLLAALAVILCVGLVMVNVLTLMLRPDLWVSGVGGSSGTLFNFMDATFAPRFLHFLFASLAVGGLAAALLARFGKERGTTSSEIVQHSGLRLFVTASVLQIASGLWWLVALDRPVLLQFMGDSVPGTALLLVSVALAVLALMAGATRKPVSAAIWTGLTILSMSGVRAVVRNATLEPWFSPGQLQVTGEISPFVFFLVTLVIGLAALAYMLRLAFFASKEG